MPPEETPNGRGVFVGQRYVSDAEPELGLGMVVGVDDRIVEVAFSAADETRRYVVSSAPIRRVRFAVGDLLTDDSGRTHRVSNVRQSGGVLYYTSEHGELVESRVAAQTAVTGPRERLASGRTDSSSLFDLRVETLRRLHDIRRSPVRGFSGPRIELLPHQFFVAAEVSSRLVPRVLLADETGLGKTIEAGLILSRLLLSGRASRVLVLVPDSLVHQWLVELRRRFQLRFAVYDEQRCRDFEDSEAGCNPFAQEQLVLAGLSLFGNSTASDVGVRCHQATEAGWDMVVVDEAHHLEWTREVASAEYRAVETIARGSAGLLLLTATPEQLGAQGHFARLRLLDPDRYSDFDRWNAEAEGFRAAARVAGELLSGAKLSTEDASELAQLVGSNATEIERRCETPALRDRLLAELIDRHGPGRVMFRNTRAAVRGFPQREVHRHALTPVAGADPHIEWLQNFLAPDGPAKVLVICRSAERAEYLETALAARIRVSTGLFHEGLTLLQRDRNAAWFAEPDGARLLICSELGSEGRNFQHAQDLVLLDLPLDPDLVEQRIGRLDRIGQRGTVQIHIPFVAGSGDEVLVRWLDEGVHALSHPSLAAHALLERFGHHVRTLVDEADSLDQAERDSRIEELVEATRIAAEELEARVEKGRDRLLEMASLRPDVAEPLLAAVREFDADTDLEDYFLRLLEHFHVYAEEASPRRFLLNPDGTRSPEFPSLDDGEVVLTFDRQDALVREDLTFATRDHPLLGDAMEAMVGSQSGNAAFAMLEDPGSPRLWLEALYVLEPVAPPRLHADRFLAPTPIRILLDQHLAEPDQKDDPTIADLEEGRGGWIFENQMVLAKAQARMAEHGEKLAEERAAAMRTNALERMHDQLGAELSRLQALAAVNNHVDAGEATALESERDQLAKAISGARLRPDALRLIWQGPTQDGAPLIKRR